MEGATQTTAQRSTATARTQGPLPAGGGRWRVVRPDVPVRQDREREARDRAADFYRRHGPAVYRRCLRLLRNREAARDATQEVFVKLVSRLDDLPPEAPVLAWLYRVASNHCLNVRRAGRHRGEDRPEGDLLQLEAAPGRDLPDLALARQVLARFDEVTRLVAVGVLVDGMEHEEVAVVLGISRRSVARKLERFLDSSRRFLVASRAGGAGDPDLAG
jgi:RNA polymerase sigma-70 factor, ECF subfamily